MCRGVFGQLIYIDIERSFVAVKLSSWPEFTSPTRLKTALKAIAALAENVL
jgi:CubicO group peptidase (beta-lactamase class C family)